MPTYCALYFVAYSRWNVKWIFCKSSESIYVWGQMGSWVFWSNCPCLECTFSLWVKTWVKLIRFMGNVPWSNYSKHDQACGSTWRVKRATWRKIVIAYVYIITYSTYSTHIFCKHLINKVPLQKLRRGTRDVVCCAAWKISVSSVAEVFAQAITFIDSFRHFRKIV